MKGMPVRLCILAVCAAVFSCSSFDIPGEKQLHADTMAAEYYAIGEEWMAAKKYSRAIIWYKKALAYPEFYNAVTLQLARAYVFSGDWLSAREKYDELLERDPENTALLSSYAYILANIGETAQALAIYKELIEKNDYDITLLKNHVTLLTINGAFDDARRALEEIKTLYPDDDGIPVIENRIQEEENKLKAAEGTAETSPPQNPV